MGKYDPTEKEMSLLSRMHIESARHRGTEVKINFVEDTNLDINHDPEYDFLDGEDLYLILDERPSEQLLRSLDWFSEDEENLPLIAYISREDWIKDKLNLLEGVKIEIPYKVSSNEGTREFEIIKVKALPPNQIAYVAHLVPLRGEYIEEKEGSTEEDVNYKYLNTGS